MKIKQKKNTLNLAELHAAMVAALTPEQIAARDAEKAAEEAAKKKAAEDAAAIAKAAKEASLASYLEKREKRDAEKAALSAAISASAAARKAEADRALEEENKFFDELRARHGSDLIVSVQRRIDSSLNGNEGLFIMRNGVVNPALAGPSRTQYWLYSHGDIVLPTNNASPQLFRKVCMALPAEMTIEEAFKIYRATYKNADLFEIPQEAITVGDVQRFVQEIEKREREALERTRARSEDGADWQDGRYESEWYGSWG